MNIISIAKGVGSLVVSIGAGALVSNLVKVSTPGNAGKVIKACIGVGGFALSGMIANYASKEVEETVDRTVDVVKVLIPSKEVPKEG